MQHNTGIIIVADKLRNITNAFSGLYNILDDADLRKAGLSLYDYRECERLMKMLGAPGNSADTICEKAAGYFKKHGFTITEKGIGYTITA